ncbi:MAG: hypothetical protein LBK44_02925, partial [Spirochaetales bacterium]|nr:hypothetical protein [Spirochaetales bacterium]
MRPKTVAFRKVWIVVGAIAPPESLAHGSSEIGPGIAVRQFRGCIIAPAIMHRYPGGRNFVLTKLRDVPPSAQRSGVHVYITNRLPGGSSEP